jgi:hypothetical protein
LLPEGFAAVLTFALLLDDVALAEAFIEEVLFDFDARVIAVSAWLDLAEDVEDELPVVWSREPVTPSFWV